ncbi:acyl carrier protein [Streptomyces ortus]|uniref:Acyl carrier protein n=1 Tax=Streptomyces ortus TaxID=2867268 RepID=A0ABT3VFY9_9ACTN|nr:acyl carrier protein [Streptomyces ortus]MCX4238857.1 acyl carrier protein [Streptomyces ortus]
MTNVDMRISDILTGKLDVDPADVTPGASFDDLGLDSLAIVEFTEILQETFEVAFTDDDVSEVDSLADVSTLLRRRGVDV